jgi:hypothetical protein
MDGGFFEEGTAATQNPKKSCGTLPETTSTTAIGAQFENGKAERPNTPMTLSCIFAFRRCWRG